MAEATKKKTINKSDYLQGLGLFVLARQHYRKTKDCELAIGELFGCQDQDGYAGSISDAIFNDDDDAHMAFDRALKAEGISVNAISRSLRKRKV